MFGIGTTELMIILVVALVVLGPKKLPQVARSLGKAFGEFKRVSTDVKRTIDVEVDRLEREDKDKKAKQELRAEDAGAQKKTEQAAEKVPVKDPTPEPDAPVIDQADNGPNEDARADGGDDTITPDASKA
jgi:sec-independent protein translocase protein TatB